MLRRPRRLRINSATRNLVRETKLNIEDLIYPLFIVEGENIKREISSLDKSKRHLISHQDCMIFIYKSPRIYLNISFIYVNKGFILFRKGFILLNKGYI